VSEDPISREVASWKINHGNEIEDGSSVAENLLIVANHLIDCAHRIRINTVDDNLSKKINNFCQDRSSYNFLTDDFLRRSADSAYKERRKRERIFGDIEIFGEPAWDMLLDLFKSEKLGKRVSVTSCCIGSAVAPTTALRWIKVLVDEGLVCREDDELDSRRTYVRLTRKANDLLGRYFYETALGGILTLRK